MNECWLCHRSYEDAQKFISEQSSEFRQNILEFMKSKTIVPICVLCRYVLKVLFLEFRVQQLQQEKDELLEEKTRLGG